MRPIVVDTNCLIQMIPKQSQYRFIWDRFVGGEWINEVKDCDWPHVNVINLDEFAIEQRR